jgi:hypothetical protein
VPVAASDEIELDDEIRLAEAWLGREGAHSGKVAVAGSRTTLQDAMRVVLPGARSVRTACRQG